MVSKSMKYGDRKIILLLVALLFWMGTIYYFSAQPAEKSDALSKGLLRIIHRIYECLSIEQTSNNFTLSNHALRKTAHVLEYALLGILVTALLQRIRLKHYFLFSVAISFLYAAFDEIHQSFVHGRGPLLSDVVLDVLGATLGILIMWSTVSFRMKGRDK